MVPALRRSNSTPEKPKSDSHPWLEEKVYARLRQRTVDLVKRSVDALSLDKQRVSLTTVAAKSKEVDTEGNGRGVSKLARRATLAHKTIDGGIANDARRSQA